MAEMEDELLWFEGRSFLSEQCSVAAQMHQNFSCMCSKNIVLGPLQHARCVSLGESLDEVTTESAFLKSERDR